jgi:hypothetical protein
MAQNFWEVIITRADSEFKVVNGFYSLHTTLTKCEREIHRFQDVLDFVSEYKEDSNLDYIESRGYKNNPSKKLYKVGWIQEVNTNMIHFCVLIYKLEVR